MKAQLFKETRIKLRKFCSNLLLHKILLTVENFANCKHIANSKQSRYLQTIPLTTGISANYRQGCKLQKVLLTEENFAN